MTPDGFISVMSGLASLAMMGAGQAAAAQLTVPGPVDRLMRADKELGQKDIRHQAQSSLDCESRRT